MQAGEVKKEPGEAAGREPNLRTLQIRACFLFLNFLLIIMALYQLKPASRSLFIQFLGADRLPYVWIGTAVVMGGLISWYHRLVGRHSRVRVVFGSCLLFGALLILFRLLFHHPHPATATAFYVFVDILGVVLVEQFWSLTNSIYSTREGKAWYGFIGTGGLLGGVIGGGAAALILNYTPLQTPDLLLVAAGIILFILLLTWVMGRLGIYREVANRGHPTRFKGGWRTLQQNRYLLLIAGILLLAQLVDPIVEYQFLKTVEGQFTELEARTTFLSAFFGVLGMVSIAVNLAITPLVHRYFGVIVGLLAQPLALGACSLGFFAHPTLLFGAAAKISDRGLSYSINRASKELLYVPIDSVLIYQAKAWIDMFGYRLFKIFGSFVILIFTQWLPFPVGVPQLSWFTFGICLLWLLLIAAIRREYLKFA
ncbi:MAG TPA: Npt1/Npt2 family nucleotide transporter [Desulfuromonadales bacterium]